MNRQQGYALLLSVFMLLGVGSLWFGGAAMQSQQSVKAETLALLRAKANLIHYAANYIDLYGAQGAGLGHLPCPDTDAPSPNAADAWRLDGPNPPCARGDIQTGWLPRHVNVTKGRFHFHTRDRQRLLYAISGNYVNNPLGRPVNPETSGVISIGQTNDVVALLVSPPLETDQNVVPDWFVKHRFDSISVAHVVIRSEDIRSVVMQRVAHWLLPKLQKALSTRCLSNNQYAECSLWLRKSSECTLSVEHQFLLWLYVGNLDINCTDLAQSLDEVFVEFEAVPFKRHWFIRNGWHRYIKIIVDQNCFTSTENSCLFQWLSLSNTVDKLSFVLHSEVAG